MGGGGTKKTTTTSDPLAGAPDWLLDSIKGRVGEGNELYDMAKGLIPGMSDPDSVAGAPPEWQEALDLIRGGDASSKELLDYAKGALGRDYESDYTDDVVDTTLSGMQRQSERDRLARDAQSAAVGGTTNTRSAVGDAIAQQLTGMNMAEMEAKLRDEGFRFGVDAGFQDADLAKSLAGQELSQGLQAGGAIGGIGEDYRNVEQEKLNAPKDALSWLGAMYGGSDPNNQSYLGSSQTTETPKPSTFSQILGAGASLGGAWLASDERVKEDIDDPDGSALDKVRRLRTREYSYLDGHGHTPDRTTGLMAQDIERAGITGAVREVEGVKHVDPYPVLATVVQAVQELDRRTA